MILCIDPGFSVGSGGTGWALFSDSKVSLFPEKTGVIKTRSGTWEERISQVVTSLAKQPALFAFMGPRCLVYIELPTFFQTEKGMSCATGKKGDDSDLVKLSILVGMIKQYYVSLGCTVRMLRINDWKGTIKKPAVAARIARRLWPGEFTVDDDPAIRAFEEFGDHALDAVGMGLFVKGVFKANAGKEVGNASKERSGTRVTGKNNTRRSTVCYTRSRPNNRR